MEFINDHSVGVEPYVKRVSERLEEILIIYIVVQTLAVIYLSYG